MTLACREVNRFPRGTVLNRGRALLHRTLRAAVLSSGKLCQNMNSFQAEGAFAHMPSLVLLSINCQFSNFGRSEAADMHWRQDRAKLIIMLGRIRGHYMHSVMAYKVWPKESKTQ